MARKPRATVAERKMQAKEAGRKASYAEGYQKGREAFLRGNYLEEKETAQQAHLNMLQNGWEQTGNPLFAWAAISVCQRYANSTTSLEARASRAAAIPGPFPDWVLRYLGSVALAMNDLIHGRDWRALGVRPDEGWGARTWKAGTLDPDEAARLIPWTLGITRPGFNAFREIEAHDNAKLLAREERRLRDAEGLTAEQAAEVLAEREGYADPRSVQRIVSKIRRRGAKPTR